MGEVLTNGVYLPDRGERNAYDGLKGNWNTLDSIAGKVPGYDAHISDTDIHVTAADKQTWNGKADASHVHNANDVTTGVFDAARIPNLDASKITTGTIDIDRLPQGALERLVKVADQAARYALTASDVQLGDTVQQLDTGVMYVVTDVTKLDSADGYTEYTAGSATSVPWSGVTGKPSSFTPSSHTHGNVTNDGKLPTASRALISDSSKNITVSSVTDTELGHLSGVTSAIQTQLNAKANDSGVVHKTGNETISGTKTFSNLTNVDLSIQKGISSGSCNIRFNDDTGLSRTVIRSYNDKLEIGHLRNANWYDGAEFILKDDGSSKIKSNDGTTSVEVSFNPDSVKPTNSVIDLGTSSNKWRSVYADSYYLGTTANLPLITGTDGVIQAGSFGTAANTFCEGNDSRLSDARTPVAHTHTKSDVTDLFNSVNTWTANNRIQAFLEMQYLASGGYTDIRWYDENNVNCCTFRQSANYLTIGKKYTGKSSWYDGAQILITAGGTVVFKGYDGANTQSAAFTYDSFYPEQNNAINLGTSTNKWKTLNGINPGALSLPNLSYSDSNKWFDISGNITDETGGTNEYGPAVDGWVIIRAKNNPTSLRVNVHAPRPSMKKYLSSATGVDINGSMMVSVPAPAGSRVYIYFNKGTGSLEVATFVTCQGNV